MIYGVEDMYTNVGALPVTKTTVRIGEAFAPVVPNNFNTNNFAIAEQVTLSKTRGKRPTISSAQRVTLGAFVPGRINVSQGQSVTPFGLQATAFLNRTSGLDALHANAYNALINGLVSDGVWSKLDVLYIFATQNTTTALLNLISSSFTGTANGSPSFTTDRGYTGVDASSTVFINTGFNPTTAPSPNYVTNSCHISAWADTAVTAGSSGGAFIGHSGAAGNTSNIYGRFSDGNAYFRINDLTPAGGFTSASSLGHWLACRTGASASIGYKNGASFATLNQTAGTLSNNNIFVLAYNLNGTASTGSACQLTMASMGGGLTATDATNFYNRLRTYMTSVGVP